MKLDFKNLFSKGKVREHTEAGFDFYEAGDYKSAEGAFREAIGLNPDFELAWHQKGNALRKSGEAKKSLRYFNIALELEPDSDEVWYSKAKALEAMGEKEEAEICFEKALALNPNNNNSQKGKAGVEAGGQEPLST